jgi:hypothetical protein
MYAPAASPPMLYPRPDRLSRTSMSVRQAHACTEIRPIRLAGLIEHAAGDQRFRRERDHDRRASIRPLRERICSLTSSTIAGLGRDEPVRAGGKIVQDESPVHVSQEFDLRWRRIRSGAAVEIGVHDGAADGLARQRVDVRPWMAVRGGAVCVARRGTMARGRR